jgi:hypothetical protein
MSFGSELQTVVFAVLSAGALTYFVRSVYKEVTDGVTAKLEKEHRARDKREITSPDASVKPTNG